MRRPASGAVRRALPAALALALAGPSEVAAHESRPALLALHERAPGHFSVAWYPPAVPGAEGVVVPRFPAACTWEATRLECPGGLSGRVQVDGLDRLARAGRPEVLLQVRFLDGSARTETLTAARAFVEIDGASRRGAAGHAGAQIGGAYLRMGVEHILGGFDHLLFVMALVLLVGFSRRLVWTITAFTAAHSLTLAASVAGLVRLPAAAVEIVIALSIALVAVECRKQEATLTRRYPWLVSSGFGLLHGFGFAGALREIGLPEGGAALALATFNLGVEVGQLGLVAVLFGVFRALQALAPSPSRMASARTSFVYAVGAMGAYWTLDRAAGLFL